MKDEEKDDGEGTARESAPESERPRPYRGTEVADRAKSLNIELLDPEQLRDRARLVAYDREEEDPDLLRPAFRDDDATESPERER